MRSSAIKNRSDSCVSGEHWLVHRAEFALDRCILPHVAVKATETTWLYLIETRRPMNLSLKVCTYAIAVRELGGSSRDQHLARKFLDLFEINDPEDYLLQKTEERRRRKVVR